MTVAEAPRRLLAISGSLRQESYSTAILNALAVASAGDATFDYANIGALPHFNQDLYVDSLPARSRISAIRLPQRRAS